MRFAVLLAVAMSAVAISASSRQADTAQELPLPESAPFLAAARENLARTTKVQDRYAYKERATELHRNPFGKIGTGGVRVHQVTPAGEPGVFMRTLLERDGQPVADARPERVERRRRAQGRSAIEDAADVLAFTLVRREHVDGRDQIVVRFEGKPDARPQTREGRMAKVLTGHIWIDEQAREVARAEATATDSVSYGLGMVVRLHKGATMSLTRAPVDERESDRQVWMVTSLRFTGEGRAMLFRKLIVNHVIEWFDYEVAK